ncbi:hypothetical protein DWV94_08440 [Streptococcus salivarius]|nr:hypothetical protein DWV94_08440 [Streptococcus salivarius]
MRVFTPLLPLGRRSFLALVGVAGVTGFSAVPSVTSL